ncbi:hypothetical protein SDC9_178333 [bioreactor metagenome]|uniref:Uncharacterized protein n=1 Tax=bioreactor metagenome TaxID=1076179 RepID=A0A645GXT8_9ZZZZ
MFEKVIPYHHIVVCMRMARNNMCIVGFQYLVKPPVVGHCAPCLLVIETLSVLFRNRGGDMHGYYNGSPFGNIREVFFQPGKLVLGNISYVKIIPANKEVVVEHHIMDLTHIE